MCVCACYMSAPHSMVVQQEKEAKDYPFHFFPFFFEQEKKREKTTEITNFVSISLFCEKKDTKII